MDLSEAPRLSFSGHETFAFRYAWPVKGVRAVERDPDAFADEDALLHLGVGKNMVKSIRHWCMALGLIEHPEGLAHGFRVTELGAELFGENGGLDPYLEHPVTLWLLHWLLVRQPHPCSSWFLAFTEWSRSSFERDELVDWLVRKAQAGRTRATAASIKRDVGVLLGTYVPSRPARRHAWEDTLDCPLVELGLLRSVGRRSYEFVHRGRFEVPQDVLIFALLDYWARWHEHKTTVPLEALAFGPGSPGMAFRLRETELIEALRELPPETGLAYDATAGMRALRGNPQLSEGARLGWLHAAYRDAEPGDD